MNADIHLEHRAGSSQGKHEGEPSLGLCDRLNLTRDNSQRQLPTDHDYAVSTREYQTDQSSLKTAPTAARSVFGKRQRQRQRQKQPHRFGGVDTVTPYQAKSLIEVGDPRIGPNKRACGEWSTAGMYAVGRCPYIKLFAAPEMAKSLLDPNRTRDLCRLNLCPKLIGGSNSLLS
jgi:hypothetical protein